MRMTTQIAAGGGRSTTRIPMPNARLEECLGANGKLDRCKAARAFVGQIVGGKSPFMAASDDDEHVYFACMTFLELLTDAYDAVTANPAADVQREAQSRQDEINSRKFEGKGKGHKRRVCYVRNDVRRCADGVRVKVTVGNPDGVVGQAEAEARAFAVACCQLWMRIKEQTAREHGDDWIRLEADATVREDAAAHNAEAEARNEADAANARREACPNRQASGYCSPCVFICPCYKAGRCAEVDWREVLKAKKGTTK